MAKTGIQTLATTATSSSKRKYHHHRNVLVLAAFLQQELQVIVTACVFLPAGQHLSSNSNGLPSSLISIEPFVPGGLRRLCLNARHPLIQQMATLLGDTKRENCCEAVVCMAETMIHTASWPIPGLDACGRVSLAWKTTPSLLCGPQAAFVWPVPHERVHPDPGSHAMGLEAIAVWPRRICGYAVKKSRGNTHLLEERSIARVYERWKLREQALKLEWNSALSKSMPIHRRTLSLGKAWKKERQSSDIPNANNENYCHHSVNDETLSLLTYSPAFPLLAMAQALKCYNTRISPTARLTAASQLLLDNDRLFGFSLFFGVPLIDRTGVLSSSQSLKCSTIVKRPPTRIEVDKFRHRILEQVAKEAVIEKKYINSLSFPVQRALEVSLDGRAEKIWQESEQSHPPREVIVAWSGGIDSTSALVALMRTFVRPHFPSSTARQGRLAVLLSDESIQENPYFYDKFFVQRPHPKRARGYDCNQDLQERNQ